MRLLVCWGAFNLQLSAGGAVSNGGINEVGVLRRERCLCHENKKKGEGMMKKSGNTRLPAPCCALGSGGIAGRKPRVTGG